MSVVETRSSNAVPSVEERFLSFSLGTEEYAVPLLVVKEVIAVPDITAIKLFINQTELAQKPATPTPTPTPNGPAGPTLSQYFQTKCANCHGQYGQKIDISKKAILKTKLTLDDFVYKVRQGGGGMPAFNTVEFPGTTLSADYSLLFNF